jgi:nucleotide-binding universal stress UspA family protein
MAYSTIVCGVTASAHAQKAALEAAIMAKDNNAKLVYVYAVDSTFLRSGISMYLTSQCIEESLERIGAQILELAEQIALTQGVTPRKVIQRGPVVEVLKKVIQEEKADLLVIGHEERTFFEKALLKGDVETHVKQLETATGAAVSIIR